MALFWNLVFPALFIIIFGTVFGDTSIEFSVGVTGVDSQYRSEVVNELESSSVFSVSVNAEEDEELRQLEDGERDVVLAFGEPSSADSIPDVTMYYDESQGPNAEVSVAAVNQVLVTAFQGGVELPIDVVSVSGLDTSFMDFLLPGILAMSIMNSGVIGLSTSFVSYRERGILRRIKVTPFPLPSFVSSRIVSQLIVSIPQALILTTIAWALFDLTIRGNPLLILFVILAGSLAFLAIGFAISSIAPNVETAASYSNLITFPMLFLSGVFFPVDSGPSWVEPITRVMPLSYLVDALREPMMRGQGISEIWSDLLILLATFVIGLAIAVRYFRWDSRTG